MAGRGVRKVRGLSRVRSRGSLALFSAATFFPLSWARAAVLTLPAVSITAPAPGALLEGTVVLSARASVPASIAGVQFRLDGADLGAQVSGPPYDLSWNTAQTADGAHLLSAEVWDKDGRSASSDAVPVVVDNAPLLITGVSTLGVTATAATIAWTTNKPADAQVEYGPTPAYGGATVLESLPAVAHSAALIGLVPGTLYHYRVKSKRAAGAPVDSDDFTFTTTAPLADTTPPSIVIMNPASGASVASTVMVSANAMDNVGVASVQFLMDGGELGAPVAAAPFLFAWNTAFVPDGPHILGAIARDAAGNAATAVVAVTVSNTAPVIAPPSVRAAAPTRVDILWTTDQRSDSAVEYGPTPAYGNSTPATAAQSTGHGVTLTGLTAGTLYHYRVKSRNAAGALAVSDDFTFVTPEASTGGLAAPAVLAAPDGSSAKAPQKFLSPASADGINDQAVFGPGAREVTIFDLRGRKVFHGTSSDPASPIVWNCRDAAGRVVPSGVYLAKILTRDSKPVYQSFAVAK